MNCIKFFSFIVFFLLTTPAYANRMQPLPSERLNKPIELDCGVIIREWRGGSINVPKVDFLCSEALSYYPKFLKKHNLERKHTWTFRFQIAFVPRGRCDRCMNDLKDRFSKRSQQYDLVGYTSASQRWLYMIGSTKYSEFNVTFVHELFHAMNVFYGLWTPTEYEEDLAEAFTKDLGYGI